MKQLLSKMLSLKAFLLVCLLIGMASGAWAQKITDYNDIVSGKKYYIGATTGGNDYYLYVDGRTSTQSTAGTAKTSKEEASVFTFEGSGASWSIKFESTFYLSLKSSKDNGKVMVVSAKDDAMFTASNQSGKLRLTRGSYSIQKNNTGNQFGSYGNTQTDVWLEEVAEAESSPLASIAVNASEAKTVFYIGDSFTHDGVVVTATYEDKSTKDVTADAIFSTPDMTSADTKTVTVTYTENEVEKTTSYDIEVKAPATLESITLSGTYPMEFTQGGVFSSEGIVVTANYDDESTKDVTGEATFSGYDMSATGTQTVTVSFGGKTATYTINVNEYVAPSQLVIDFENDLATYSEWTFENIGTSNTTITAHGGSKYGANINTGGNGVGTCTIATTNKINPAAITFYISKVSTNTSASSWYVEVSENGTSWAKVDVADAKSMSKGEWKEISYDLKEYSDVYVRIRYNGSTAIRAIDDITLELASTTPKVLSSIALSGEYPTTFHVGDAFSHANMIVTATYEGDTTADVTDEATFTGYDMSIAGTQEVTVSYTEGEVTKTAIYSITVNAPATLSSIVLSGTYKTEFTQGDEFSSEGIVVTANYDDETTKIVTTEASFSGYDMETVGEQTVVVTYADKTSTYTITVAEKKGIASNPYTVAEARAAIDAGTGVTGVYATGIVSEIVTEYSSQYNNITFDISVDGKETSDQLRAYRCGGTDAADAADVQVGDIVIISGNLIFYNKDNIYEFAQGCKLEFLVHPSATICATPTFDPESGEVVAGSTVTISTTTEDATIYYTVDETEPTAESTEYTEPITITEATTIKAIAVKEGMTNSTVATATYTIALPVATPTFTPAAGTYSSAQEVTISCETDDATIYYSYDNENWTEYTETLNINESKTVYAKAEKEGMVTSYANAAYTMQIPSITFVNDATPKNLTYEAQNYDFAFEVAYTIGSFTVVVCDYEGNPKSYDWFSAELIDNAVRVTLTQNEDMENGRTAFFKVTADNATSEVFSVVQNNYVPDYATLPFAYDGNATGELPDGLTQNGLGTKTYGSSPKIGFDTTDDYLILKINERPGTLTFDIKGNTFSGGTFTVQTSEDGVDYTDLETYTDLGATQNEEFNNLGENVRYIKWIYTEKVSGNVALGNIALTQYSEPVIEPSITLSSYSIYATAAETEGTLELTYENLTITASSDFDVKYCDSEGEETDAPNWIVAGIAKADGDGSYAVSYVIEANEGEARTANFKVYAMDDETNLVYSDIVTITQEAYVAPLPSITYSLASSITSGKHYLITNGNKIVMGADKGNNRNAVEVNMSDSKLSVTDEAVQEVVICGPDANGYYTLYADGYLYAASSSSNYLKTQATADANGLWSIVIDEDGVATIQAKGSYTRNNMRYNSGSNIFSCYGSGQNDIYLYERDDEEAPEASYSRATSVDNWGTICLPNTATITGAKLYSIEGVDSKDAPSVIYLNEYKGTAVAGTPYLFQATENAIHAYYTGDAAEETLNNNGLFGSFERMDVEEGKYLLSEGVIVRCGENCHIGANRAYIDMSLVPEYEETGEAGVKMLYLYNPTTGINGIDANGEGAVIYDLSGRRLSKTQKGLYIVNGKKVAVK